MDQGYEHGPARSFSPNPEAYDHHYHYKLAIDAGLNAYADPLGMLEAGADTFAGQIPTILKLNSANSLGTLKDQAVHGSIEDALKLGCLAVGFTIYPGSEYQFEMMEELKELALEAKSLGLAVVVWSYPRGGNISKEGETAMDICAYAAHIAALLGAHIIKVKPPTAHIEQKEAQASYKSLDISSLSKRVAHVMQSSFNNRRIVVFSGNAFTNMQGLLNDIKEIRDGGGNGSIIGRNTFQRPREEALAMLNKVIDIYKFKN